VFTTVCNLLLPYCCHVVVILTNALFFTRHTVAVSVEVVRIAQTLLEHPLCLLVGIEAGAVKVALFPTPRSGRLGRCWRFRLRA
jgi:hypothetical protein